MTNELLHKIAIDYWLEKTGSYEPVEISATSIAGLPGPMQLQSFLLPETTAAAIRNVCNDKEAGVYLYFLAALHIIVQQYTSSNNILVACAAPLPAREAPLFLGAAMDAGMEVRQLLVSLQNELKEAWQHKDYSFGKFTNQYETLYGSVAALFNYSFAYIPFTGANDFTEQSKLAFTIHKTTASFEITIAHATNYAGWFIERLGEQYMRILEIIAQNPTEKIGAIPLLTVPEKQQLLEAFNDTMVDFPDNKLSIIELFERQAKQTPEQVAVESGQHSLTYHQLWLQCIRLAAWLQQKGIGHNSIVALICERSEYIAIGMLGALKAGAAYVPIDPDLPCERVDYIMKDSAAEAMLTTRAFFTSRPELFTHYAGSVLFMDEMDTTNIPAMAEGSVNAPGDPAYIIYTSGSTGRPKGIVILHKGFLNLVLAFKSCYASGFTTADRCLLLANIAFDASVGEIYMCLLSGSTLVILDKERLFDPARLADFMVEQAITFAYIPPVLLKDVFRCLQPHGDAIRLNKLFVGVEPIKDTLLYDYCALIPGVDIFNVYGPTEATVISTGLSYIPQPPVGENVSIGKPIPNYRIHIVSNSLQLLPVGVPGEVCVSGVGVGQRYLNNEELSASKFIDDPFNPGEKMFRTGDLAKWTPDGNIVFVGRKDNQVKVRGYRVELGEIESVLLNHPAIKEAVVSAIDDKAGGKYLHAWLVPATREMTVSFPDIRTYLSRLLPEYMIPSGFMVIDHMPVTSNGKTDRRRLPAPAIAARVIAEKDKPSTELERKLLPIWKEVLTIQEVGVNDNFFELGGHSLKAARLITIILRDMGVEVPLRQVFTCGTIKALAAYIEKKEQAVSFDIPVAPALPHYPVSFAQRRLYLSYLLNKDVTNYNIPVAYTVKGVLDIDRLAKACTAIIAKHESLRTCFAMVEDVLVQQVMDVVPFHIAVEKQMDHFVRPFDLSRPPLFRVAYIQQSADEFILLIDMHHIISDGISLNLLLKELGAAYHTGSLSPLPLQYKDYACWLNQYRQTPAFEGQKNYWLSAFANKEESVALPLDFPRPNESSFQGENVVITIDAAVVAALRKLAKDNNSTLFMVSFAAYYVLLYKYSGEQHMTVGIPVAGRIHPALNDIVGMFVNTLPIPCTVQPKESFVVLLNQLMENFFKAIDNQLYPFEELIETLDLERTGSRNPLFDTMFSFLNMEMDTLQLQGLSVQSVNVNNTAAKFDLSVEIIEAGEELQVTFNYATDLFVSSTIERMAAYYRTLLAGIGQAPEKALAALSLLTEDELELLPGLTTSTKARTVDAIHQLFEVQAAAVPRSVAIACNDTTITYEELYKKVNALAAYWVSRGLKKGAIVAVLAERNEQLIIGLLAILKAGAIYLPIEPGYPAERIAFMLEDAQCAYVFKTGIVSDAVDALIAGKQVLDTDIQPVDVTLPAVNAQDVAYIIYTSGSTGKPKGVVVEHASIVNYISWAADYYCKDEPAAMPLFTSPCFDLTLTAIFTPLATGNTIVIYNGREEGLLIEKILTDNTVDIVKCTPAHLRLLNNIDTTGLLLNSRIHTFIVGGEALESQLAEEIYHKSGGRVTIYNEYGPTEATVGCMIYAFFPADPLPAVPIGEPIQNTCIYLLDRDSQFCTTGITGEICIAGEGLARGYLNRPELTEEKFTWITNPHGQLERIYRTGDLGRWLPDNNLLFEGRKDEQLKINGYRIEPGEIENILLNYPAVEQAVITVVEGKGESKTLAAYFVAAEQMDVSVLKTFLASRVPSYMVPAWLVQVDHFPLTSNGKINRKALPAPVAVKAAAIVLPETEMEKQLLEIWQSVLETNTIGITDNFFESGGHSLKALVLVSRIQKSFHIEVTLRDIFNHATVQTLARYLSTAAGIHFVPIARVAKQAHYPLSSAQKRIFVLSHFKGAETTYNIYHACWIDGLLDVAKLQAAFRTLIQRHESLRTSFYMMEDEPVQVVHDTIPFELLEVPCEADVDEQVSNFIRQFDLMKAPLFRAQVVKVTDERRLLLFDMHHIISDGGSLAIFNRELWDLYNGNPLPEITIQYKDYAAWQRSLFNSGAVEIQKQYWKTQFAGSLPVLNMPLDYPRPTNQTFAGRNYYFASDARTNAGVFNFIKEKKVTLNMFMLTVYNILLAKYTSQEDIIIGTPAAGRSHADLEPIIGMFVNTLALRNYPTGEKSFEQFLEEVKTNTLTAYENQDYPFEELIQLLNLKRDTSRNPLFDTMFLLINHHNGQQAPGLTFTDYPVNVKVAKLDLVFETVQLPDAIEYMINYNTALFKPETIKRLGNHFIHIINQVIANPAVSLQQIVLPDEQEAALLKAFAGAGRPAEAPQQTIPGLWKEQVKKCPGRVALVTSCGQLTVEQLDQRSSAMAAYMQQEYAVKAGDKVAVLLPRHANLLVALLAILKTGAAYIPVDPNFPAGRITYILHNSGCSLVITDKAVEYDWPVFTIHGDWENSTPALKEITINADDLAYITYTSGSTGMPKGVMIEHGNVVAFTQNLEAVFGITPHDTILAITNITFDISVLETLCSLMAGVTVVLANDSEVNNYGQIGQLIHDKKITVLQLTPSRLLQLLQYIGPDFMQGIRVLLVGGEAMPKELFHTVKTFAPTRVFNLYGPTETCIWSTADEIKDDQLTIGRPLPGEQVMIVGTNNQLQPVHIPGEICIAGTGVGRGYYGNAALTTEKFFSNKQLSPGRIYKTGDIGRWLPNGRIEYIGRADNQVKLRGYRIELGEIENALCKYDGIAIAAAVLTDGDSGKHIVAFYESAIQHGDTVLRAFLANFLPAYMLPVRCIQVRTMPLTSSGKIDRIALEAMAQQQSLINHELLAMADDDKPVGAIQQALVTIWKEILNVDHIGISDNIFGLGADSIKLIKVLNRIKKEMGIDLPLTTAFTYTSVKELAEYIRTMDSEAKSEESSYSLINPGKEQIIFCFPPFLGYSFVYTALASYLPDYTLCCFHFQDMNELLQVMMNRQQPGVPFILMGYSFGGNLAFEVAAALEAEGQEVADIILVDSYKRLKAAEKTQEELEAMIDDAIGSIDMTIFGENAACVDIIKEQTRHKMLHYARYMNGKIDRGQVNARIHLLKSENDEENVDAASLSRDWENNTSNQFTIYQGKGVHADMLDGQYLSHNAAYLQAILQQAQQVYNQPNGIEQMI